MASDQAMFAPAEHQIQPLEEEAEKESNLLNVSPLVMNQLRLIAHSFHVNQF